MRELNDFCCCCCINSFLRRGRGYFLFLVREVLIVAVFCPSARLYEEGNECCCCRAVGEGNDAYHGAITNYYRSYFQPAPFYLSLLLLLSLNLSGRWLTFFYLVTVYGSLNYFHASKFNLIWLYYNSKEWVREKNFHLRITLACGIFQINRWKQLS